ncbi:hypothetical protein ACHWQZ_G016610 [Mnemiopsis leidyi]
MYVDSLSAVRHTTQTSTTPRIRKILSPISYRLFTFFSKHLLHIKVDPEKSGQIVLRTWPLEAVGVDARKGRDVMRICYQRTGQAIGLCLEGNDEDNKVFCFNDHLESEEHCFAFHYCTGNLFFNPLKGDHDFSVKFCPKNKCLAPEFTKVVCCQKILKFKNGNRPEQQHIIQPGIFARYHLNENQNRLLLGPDTFYNLDTIGGAAPVLSISQFTSQHEVLSASLLMPCDLANMSRGCLLNVDTPAFDVDHMVGKPFPWCEAGMRDIRSGGIRDWPKLYRAAYFDVANTAFIVLFDGRTVGCFFSDGTFDLQNKGRRGEVGEDGRGEKRTEEERRGEERRGEERRGEERRGKERRGEERKGEERRGEERRGEERRGEERRGEERRGEERRGEERRGEEREMHPCPLT